MPVARGALRGQGRIAVGSADRGALGLASIANQPPFQRIEAVGGGVTWIKSGRTFLPDGRKILHPSTLFFSGGHSLDFLDGVCATG